jgi:hypothetical protein
MSAPLFKLSHFEALNSYRISLQQALPTIERVKADLGLISNQAFMRLHQPSLDNALMQARAQLQNWPQILEWPSLIFYQQSDLIADIKGFNAEYSRVLSTMSATERRGFLSSLDFSRAPFELNGRLKVLRPGAGYPFAQETKQQLFNLWHQYDGAAFTCSNLYQNSSLILPRLINFMEAAIDAYASANNVDPLSNDPRIVTVKALIQTTENDLARLAEATRDFSEGYSNLASFLAGALNELVDLFTSITIERFYAMVESVVIRLEFAEKLISHTRQ